VPFVAKSIGGGRVRWNVTWTPPLQNHQLARKLAVRAAIRAKMQCDKKCLLAAADASKKHNLMAVGGHADNAVDLCTEDNTDAKRQCLGKGQTMLTKQPSSAKLDMVPVSQ
jgi:hypothetical protein